MKRGAGWIAFGLLLAGSFYVSEISPARLWTGLPAAGRYVWGTLPDLRWATLSGDVAAWMWGWKKWLGLLGDTILIAYLGTLLGSVGGFLLSFVAARNVTPRPWLGSVARRGMELARTVPELVFALVFVMAFGLGPLAGVLALAVHAVGAIGKLCMELVEHAEGGPMEGLRASGANWWETVRYGVAPQVTAGFLSYALYRFEVNVRAASVIGFVGVGGIGQELYVAIRQFVYADISAIVLLIVVAVAVTDQLSERLRKGMLA